MNSADKLRPRLTRRDFLRIGAFAGATLAGAALVELGHQIATITTKARPTWVPAWTDVLRKDQAETAMNFQLDQAIQRYKAGSVLPSGLKGHPDAVADKISWGSPASGEARGLGASVGFIEESNIFPGVNRERNCTVLFVPSPITSAHIGLENGRPLLEYPQFNTPLFINDGVRERREKQLVLVAGNRGPVVGTIIEAQGNFTKLRFEGVTLGIGQIGNGNYDETLGEAVELFNRTWAEIMVVDLEAEALTRDLVEIKEPAPLPGEVDRRLTSDRFRFAARFSETNSPNMDGHISGVKFLLPEPPPGLSKHGFIV